MKHAVSIKRTMILNALSMLTSFAMFLGCTFAWYSDSVSSNVNRVESGLFRVNAYHQTWTGSAPSNITAESTAWTSIEGTTELFMTALNGNNGNNGTALKLWEPGAMAVESFKIENAGELALKYQFNLVAAALNQVTWSKDIGNSYDLRSIIKVAIVDDVSELTTREKIISGNLTWNTLAEFLSAAQRTGVLMPKTIGSDSDSDIFTVVMYWAPNDGDVDNHYNLYARGLGTPTVTKQPTNYNYNNERLFVDLKMVVNATQHTSEADSFNNLYDGSAEIPDVVFAPLAVTINSTAKKAIENGTIELNDTVYTAPAATQSVATEITDSSATSTIPAAATLTLGKQINGETNVETNTPYAPTTLANSTDTVTGLSRSIKTTENTSSSVTYDIGYKATVTTTVNEVVTGTAEYAVHKFSSIVTNVINVGAGLSDVKVKHGDTDMNELQSNSPADNSFYYDSAAGKLYIYSSTYSTYRVSWTEPDVMIVSSSGTSYLTLAKFRDSVNGANGQTANTYADATVTLIRNVNLSGSNWTPIGTKTNPFSGVFNGNGKTISGLTINLADRDSGDRIEGQGLFGYVTGTNSGAKTLEGIWDSTKYVLTENQPKESDFSAVIKNLTVSGFSVTGAGNYGCFGAVVGYATDAYIGGVTVSNGTVAIREYNDVKEGKVGGVVGATAGNMMLADITVAGNVTVSAAEHSVGGIAGNVQRERIDHETAEHLVYITDCVNNATVNAEMYLAGGIVGNAGSNNFLYTAIINCTNNGAVTADTKQAAGIVGSAHSKTLLLDCTNNGTVTLTHPADQKLGLIAGIATESYNGGYVKGCTNSGTLSATYANEADAAKANIVSGIILGNSVDLYAVNYNEANKAADFAAGAYKDKQSVIHSGNLSYVKYVSQYEVIVTENANPANSVGMSLAQFRDSVNSGNSYADKTATLQRDVTLTGAWIPIAPKGDKTCSKQIGTFNGAGHTITGLNVSGYEYGALFGEIVGTVENLTVYGTSSGVNAGGIVGRINEGTIQNCNNYVTVTGTVKAGGVCCMTHSGNTIITGCTNYGAVSLASRDLSADANDVVGGVVGYAIANTTITNCVNQGAIHSATYDHGTVFLGGILGYGTVNEGNPTTSIAGVNSSLMNCTNSGAITKDNVEGPVGGTICGFAKLWTISDNTSSVAGSIVGTAQDCTGTNISAG